MFHVEQLKNSLKKLRLDQILFLFFVFLIPFQLRFIVNPAEALIGTYFSYPKAIFVYSCDIIFILFLIRLFHVKQLKQLFPGSLIILIGYMLINLFHVEQFDTAIYGIIRIIQFWLIIGYIRTNEEIIPNIKWVLIYTGLFQAFLAILQFHVQHDLGLRVIGEYMPDALETGAATLNTIFGKVLRAYGTFPHPNVLGGFLSITLLLWYSVSRRTIQNRKNIIIVSCGTIILTWGLLVSFSRSAWLAAAIGLLVLGSWDIYKKAYKHGAILAFLVVVSCGTFFLFHKQLVLPRAIDISENSPAAKYRNQYSHQSYLLMSRNPIFGLGTYQYVPVSHETFVLPDWAYQPVHNVFLLFLAEQGIGGVLIYLYIIKRFGFTWNIFKNPLNIALLSVLFILGIFDHYLLTMLPTYLFLALIMGVVFYETKTDVSQLRETSKY